MNTENKTQLAIIGAGPGGYVAAFLAADMGMQVTLIDSKPNPGGVCLYQGCIPSKAFLHTAKILSEAKEAKNFGIDFGQPKIDIEKLRKWKQDVVSKMTAGLGVLTKQRKITYLQGLASFADHKTLHIEKSDGSSQELSFEHAMIATGSQIASLPNLPANSTRIMNSTHALELKDVPKTLLIIGGGYIGLELGTVYASLGSQVTVVEMLPDILPGADRDLVQVFKKRFKTLFHAVKLQTKVIELTETKKGIAVKFQGPDKKENEEEFEKVLVSIGRKPNSGNLGLENTKIEVDQRGFIKVDPQRKTAEKNIYAIGDVAGEPMLAHKASHEGRLAVEVIAGSKAVFEPKAIPAVVFTDPEIAWCGLTEDQAKKQGRNVEIAKFPWGASGRATTLGRNDGLTKLIIDPGTKRILGMGIVGPGAGELIAEGVVAVEMGAIAADIKLSIHPHPTLSETIMESAEVLYGQCSHIFSPKK